MTHYVVEGGPFARTCAEYLKTHAPALYQDQKAAMEMIRRAGRAKAGAGGDDEGDDEVKAKSPGRVKFQCRGCELNAWAKPSAKLRCDDCDRPMRVVEKEEPDGED